jgi:hypothetical protein
MTPVHQPDGGTGRVVVCYLHTANSGTLGQRLLERQRARLEAVCAAHGWTVAAWIEDMRQSGATMDRTGLRHVLALLAEHRAEAMVADHPSCLAVDPTIADQLQALATKEGWRVYTPATAMTSVRADGLLLSAMVTCVPDAL